MFSREENYEFHRFRTFFLAAIDIDRTLISLECSILGKIERNRTIVRKWKSAQELLSSKKLWAISEYLSFLSYILQRILPFLLRFLFACVHTRNDSTSRIQIFHRLLGVSYPIYRQCFTRSKDHWKPTRNTWSIVPGARLVVFLRIWLDYRTRRRINERSNI